MINKNNILAIDFGTKLIGLAICYKDTSFSVPYATLENKSNVYSELKRIVEEELIDLHRLWTNILRSIKARKRTEL